MRTVLEVVGVEEVVSKLEQIKEKVQDPSEVMLDIAESMLLPEVRTASMTVWNVRTGHYSNSWYSRKVSDTEIEIGNEAEYAAPLEEGWTTRGRSRVPSPGVLFPVLLEMWPAITERWDSWAREITSR